MTTDCTMLEDSSVGVEDGEEDNEIELSLGLSIGGSYRNSKESKPVEQKSMDSCIKSGTRLTENHQISDGDIDPDGAIDPQSKREIQALRRQEARNKMEVKLKKALFRGIHGKVSAPNCFTEDKACLEARDFEAKIRDRESRENDDVLLLDQPARKREKIEIVRENCVANEEIKDLSLALSLDGVSNSSPPTPRSGSSSIPVVPSQYPQPPLQYVPFTNGVVYPCVVPCWAAVSGNVGNEATACRSFRPFQGNRNSVHSDSKDGGGNWKPVSDGSRGCSSSAISDYFQSRSPKGASISSDTGSNSSHSQPGHRHHLNNHSHHHKLNYSAASDDPLEQSEHGDSSNPLESNEAMNKASSIPHSIPAKPSEHPKSDTPPLPLNNPIPTTHNPTPAIPQTQNQDTLSRPQMPCVSTTGNGPNGKTISGFLHRYTKTEVSIVCVCHGISFSPAEFVAHAGGIDIAHPLRHITVVSSSACGR